MPRMGFMVINKHNWRLNPPVGVQLIDSHMKNHDEPFNIALVTFTSDCALPLCFCTLISQSNCMKRALRAIHAHEAALQLYLENNNPTEHVS